MGVGVLSLYHIHVYPPHYTHTHTLGWSSVSLRLIFMPLLGTDRGVRGDRGGGNRKQ
jgi:hypothetical protein